MLAAALMAAQAAASAQSAAELAAAAAAAAAMGVFIWLKEKKKWDWVENFAIAGSMLIGMIATVLVSL